MEFGSRVQDVGAERKTLGDCTTLDTEKLRKRDRVRAERERGQRESAQENEREKEITRYIYRKIDRERQTDRE